MNLMLQFDRPGLTLIFVTHNYLRKDLIEVMIQQSTAEIRHNLTTMYVSLYKLVRFPICMYTTKEEVGDPGYIQTDAVYVVQYCIISLIISDRTIHFRQLGMCRNRNVAKISIKCIISNFLGTMDHFDDNHWIHCGHYDSTAQGHLMALSSLVQYEANISGAPF